MEDPHANQELVRSRGNRSRGSSRAQRRIEREQKREQNLRQDGQETHLDLDEASSPGERIVSYVSESLYQSDRNREIEILRKQIKELELEMRGWH